LTVNFLILLYHFIIQPFYQTGFYTFSELMTQERNWEEADNVRVYVSLPEFSFVTVIKMMEKMYCLEGGDEDVIDESGELAALAELLQIQQVFISIHPQSSCAIKY